MKKMVSMKMKPADRTKSEPSLATSQELYPWGLTLNLDDAALAKLKMTELPEVDEVLMVMAKVKVTSVSSHDSARGSSRSVSLQVTDMCLHDEDEMEGVADALYKKDA